MPSECGNLISRSSGDVGAAVGLPLAVPDRERGPFADAVGGEDGRAAGSAP